MNLLYLLSIILLIISFLILKKNNKKNNIINSIIYSICFIFPYQTVLVYISGLSIKFKLKHIEGSFENEEFITAPKPKTGKS